MLHDSLDLLVPAMQSRSWDFLDRCRGSEVLARLNYEVRPLETLRELAVQMAYAVKSRMRARPEDGMTDLQWVQAFFRKAGLEWVPSAEENTRPSTWTLESKHLEGKAMDVALWRDGKEDWSAPSEAWEEVWAIARSVGLACGADFKGARKDPGHFELA